MSNASGPAPGWYQDPSAAGFERWWDGIRWGEQQRPLSVPPTPPPAPTQPMAMAASGPYAEPKRGRSGCLGIATGVMVGIVAAVVVLAGGCIALIARSSSDDPVVVAPGATRSTTETAAEPEPAAEPEDAAETEDADLGSRDNPLPLGTVHSREVGLTGTGWDLSIDRVERVGLGQFAEAGETGECLVVAGTATAREVETDDGLSNIFSFPEIVAVVGGIQLNPIDSFPACDTQPEGFENHLTSIDMSFAQGGSGNWVTSFHLPESGAPLDWVAVEDVVYATE